MNLNVLIATAASPTAWSYFVESNFAGKAIVLFLVACSFAAWTLMIGKFLDLNHKRQLNHILEKQLNSVSLLHELKGRTFTRSPYAHLIVSGLESCTPAIALTHTSDNKQYSAVPLSHIENALQRSLSIHCLEYESKMVPLGSIVSGAPFVGLLGTVWGVMDAFGALGAHNNATLQTLAPGVSGALLATVAGLLVAIPSVFGYNYLLTRVKLMVTELENFASKLADRFEQEQNPL